MTHYRFFYSRIVPRKRERERNSTRIKHPSSKDEEKKEWGRKIVEIAEKRNKARNGSGVAWSRGYVQRSTRAAIRGILVLLVLAHARVRALIPTTLVHSFKHTRRSLSCAFARSSRREWRWWGDDRAPRGGEKSSRGGDGQRGPREGGAEGKRQLFNASAGKENEVAAEFSFSRDISLPLPFPSTPPPVPVPSHFLPVSLFRI